MNDHIYYVKRVEKYYLRPGDPLIYEINCVASYMILLLSSLSSYVSFLKSFYYSCSFFFVYSQLYFRITLDIFLVGTTLFVPSWFFRCTSRVKKKNSKESSRWSWRFEIPEKKMLGGVVWPAWCGTTAMLIDKRALGCTCTEKYLPMLLHTYTTPSTLSSM